MVEHVNITDPDIHEPKGASSADVNKVYKSDGAGSGTWELLRDTGWGFYQDTTGGTQVFTTTASKLVIDGGGAANSTDYLPLSIRGSGQLWDTTNNKITPIAIADGYDLRLDLSISATTGGASYLELELDIGGAATPTNVVVNKTVNIFKTTPLLNSVGFSIFTLNTFFSNGGQIFLKSDAGTITVDEASIFIKRCHYE